MFCFQDDAAENGSDCGNVSRQEACKRCSSPVSFYHFKIKFFNVVEQREVVTSRCHGNKIFGCQQTELHCLIIHRSYSISAKKEEGQV